MVGQLSAIHIPLVPLKGWRYCLDAAPPRCDCERRKNSPYLCGRLLEWVDGRAESGAKSRATLDFGAARQIDGWFEYLNKY